MESCEEKIELKIGEHTCKYICTIRDSYPYEEWNHKGVVLFFTLTYDKGEFLIDGWEQENLIRPKDLDKNLFSKLIDTEPDKAILYLSGCYINRTEYGTSRQMENYILHYPKSDMGFQVSRFEDGEIVHVCSSEYHKRKVPLEKVDMKKFLKIVKHCDPIEDNVVEMLKEIV